MLDNVHDSPASVLRLYRALVKEDVCPKCLGELDTGYECNDCGFDAMPVVNIPTTVDWES